MQVICYYLSLSDQGTLERPITGGIVTLNRIIE